MNGYAVWRLRPPLPLQMDKLFGAYRPYNSSSETGEKLAKPVYLCARARLKIQTVASPLASWRAQREPQGYVVWGVSPSAKRPEGRAARGRPGNVWQGLCRLKTCNKRKAQKKSAREKRKLRAARGSGITATS